MPFGRWWRRCRPTAARGPAPGLRILAGAVVVAVLPSILLAQKRVTLVVAATTDVHGRIRGWDYYANAADPSRSLAGAATIIDSVRTANPGGVVLLEGGDILQGNPLTFVAARVAPPPVHPVIAAMNVMRYDAAVLGNHEFNYGVPALRKAIGEAGFPFLAANLVDRRGKGLVAPWALLQRQGVTIAVVGATTPGSNVWDRDHLRRADLVVGDIMHAVRTSVAQARKKADLVIVLLHSGLDEPASYDTAATGLPSENVAARVAKEIPGIDVVVFGHSHREVIDTVINGALVMQPRNWAASVALGTLTLAKTKGKWTVVGHRGQSVRVAGHAESPAVLAASAMTHRNTIAWVTTPVGRTAVTWRSDSARVIDMPITDLVNEVMRRTAGADLSATAAFSLDATLDRGAITQAALSRLYPYDNTLRAVRVTGAQLRAFLEHSARYYRTVGADGRPAAGGMTDPQVPGFNFDIVSGADYTIDLTKPVGRRLTKLEYRGRAVAPTDSFTLALNNYRQGGGGGYAMLAGAPIVYDQDVDIRQLLIDEVLKVGTLDPARYATTNWSIEPSAARAAALAEQLGGRGAEATGRPPAGALAGAPPAGARPATVPPPPPVRPGPPLGRVINRSDFHAPLGRRAEAAGSMGGAVALTAAIRSAQRECGSPACESVVVDAGDLFRPDAAQGRSGGARGRRHGGVDRSGPHVHHRLPQLHGRGRLPLPATGGPLDRVSAAARRRHVRGVPAASATADPRGCHPAHPCHYHWRFLMSDATIRVYVNDRGVSVPAGSCALDAVRALFPDDATGIETGRLRLTDSRGLPIGADEHLVNGLIYRVVASRDRTAAAPADGVADEPTP